MVTAFVDSQYAQKFMISQRKRFEKTITKGLGPDEKVSYFWSAKCNDFCKIPNSKPFICQMGCAYSSPDQNQIIMHLIMWHSRDYLKFLIGLPCETIKADVQLPPIPNMPTKCKHNNPKSKMLVKIEPEAKITTEELIAQVMSKSQKIGKKKTFGARSKKKDRKSLGLTLMIWIARRKRWFDE